MATSQFPLPTSFNSSPLVRLLASLGIAPATAATKAVAEPLSQWVAWTDAIALSQVLADAPAPGAAAAGAGTPVGGAAAQVARVRSDLTDAIVHDALFAETGLAGACMPDFPACRRQYRAHQHTMEDRVGELRAQVRTALAGASPALARLAALDAVLDRALAAHQRRLLEKLPALLDKRLRALQAARPDHAPAPAGTAAAALAVGPTLQRVLLAELETRLQPVQGLIDAIGHDAAAAA
jgi:hypothetical protein